MELYEKEERSVEWLEELQGIQGSLKIMKGTLRRSKGF